jgi:preprotein translocase subunit SecA
MFAAVCEETQAALTQGRAVLIGVRSVQASERLSAALLAQGIQHGLLNARHEKTEAEMISKAGKPGQVIVATNMAGRGTDIKLEDSVKTAGGLLVLITQVHETRRIDRQLIGRCGRQGDPGSYRFHVHLTDDILELAHGPDMARALRAQIQSTNRSKILPLLMAAQRRLSRRSETNRYAMMHQEERRLTTFWRSGIDPLLDLAD